MDSYIGITGFMGRQEVKDVLRSFSKGSKRKLMVGVLASSKTLNGQQNKYPGRYPKIEKIKDIFFQDPRVINLIHYSTDEPKPLINQLTFLMDIAGFNIQGIQLNIAWPKIDQLALFKETFPGQKIVLQVGSNAMEKVKRDPWKIADEIKKYIRAEAIDGILLDSSGGKGAVANFSFYQQCIKELEGYDIGIGVAGGLKAELLPIIRMPYYCFPKVSLDAEGALRDKQDDLDIAKANAYAKGAIELLDQWDRWREKKPK
ncbi:MAG TPA: hypothetical protein P5089_03470 [Candidatus Portnoybacteria bacterium]|nr:hypothetical protein [Candidatus Portnoybacteria bacterium]